MLISLALADDQESPLVFSCAGAATAGASTSVSVRARTCRIALMGISRSAGCSPPAAPTSASIKASHELHGEAGLLVGVLDADRPAVDDG